MAKVEAADVLHGSTHPSVRGRWDYVRKKLRRRGVVEVNKSHPHCDTLEAVQVGIRELLTKHPELGAKNQLSAEDYNHKIHFTVHSSSGKSYRFASYSTSVFACIRRAVDVSDEDYLENLAPTHLPYLEFISNSRSGQDFYFSNNQRFILKTDKENCIKYFLSILKDYLGHFLQYPHSLLVKFLGLYSIKPVLGEKVVFVISRHTKYVRKYLLVMQSIFFPTPRIEERFDIKGCLYNRFQNPSPKGKKTLLILKDLNFLEEKIDLGGQRDWFIEQINADVEFLHTLGVQDYSLLLGKHPIYTGDKKESVHNLVIRMKKSFGQNTMDPDIPNIDSIEQDEDSAVSVKHVQSSLSSTQNQNSLNGDLKQSDITPTPGAQCETNTQNSSGHVPLANIKQSSRRVILQSLSDSDYLDSTGMTFKNRRLLLNCKNNLHIIDGQKYRYYIGIIDFFTLYRLRQKAGKIFKDVKTCCGSHSTEPPDVYSKRFCEFIAERTT